MKEQLKTIFNTIYLKVNGFEYYFGNKKVDKEIDLFLKNLPVNVGEDFLWNFTIFQFAYYEGMKTRFDRIFINWIYGKKALLRWNDKNKEQVYWSDEFRKKYRIISEIPKVDISDHNNMERLRFEDKGRQIYHCLAENLFKECEVCSNCVNFETCKGVKDVQ